MLVPEGATVKFDATNIPKWIDNDPKVKSIWLDYSLAKCERCDDAVKRKILKSDGPNEVARPEKLKFTVLTPKEFTKASLMNIRIRSAQATVSGDEVMELERVSITEDLEDYEGGILYVREGTVDFEYKIQIHLQDGTPHESGWIRSDEREVVIGERQIRDNIPAFDN